MHEPLWLSARVQHRWETHDAHVLAILRYTHIHIHPAGCGCYVRASTHVVLQLRFPWVHQGDGRLFLPSPQSVPFFRREQTENTARRRGGCPLRTWQASKHPASRSQAWARGAFARGRYSPGHIGAATGMGGNGKRETASMRNIGSVSANAAVDHSAPSRATVGFETACRLPLRPQVSGLRPQGGNDGCCPWGKDGKEGALDSFSPSGCDAARYHRAWATSRPSRHVGCTAESFFVAPICIR